MVVYGTLAEEQLGRGGQVAMQLNVDVEPCRVSTRKRRRLQYVVSYSVLEM